MKLDVDREYIEDETLVTMAQKSNYHLVLDHNAQEPTSHEVDPYAVPEMVQVRERRDLGTRSYHFGIKIVFVPHYIKTKIYITTKLPKQFKQRKRK